MFRRQSKRFILTMVNRLIYKKMIMIFNIMNKVIECLTRFEGFWGF